MKYLKKLKKALDFLENIILRIKYSLYPEKTFPFGFDNYKYFFIEWSKWGLNSQRKYSVIKKQLIREELFEEFIQNQFLIEQTIDGEKWYSLGVKVLPIINIWNQEASELKTKKHTRIIIKLTGFTIFVSIVMGIFEATKFIFEQKNNICVIIPILAIISIFLIFAYFIFYDSEPPFIPPKFDNIDDSPIDELNANMRLG